MQQRSPRRQLIKAGLAVTLLSLIGYGCVGIAPPSSQVAVVTSPGASEPDKSGPLPTGADEATLGPSRTKKPKRSTTPTQPTEPTTTLEPTTQPTDTTLPTDMPTSPASSGGGLHLHSLPIINFPSLVILQPPPPATLDYQASANYGEANLSAGFSPDPYSVGMTTGGPIDVSYLGSSCAGFATSAPDLRVNFGGGGATLLRMYFVGSNGDPAMVINDPYGNFYCVDDSFGTVNPTIDFNNPTGGSYDIWIASYASGTTISGTLYLSENSGNHP